MVAAQPDSTKGGVKQRNLSFEDFLEALVRIAVLKCLPTDDEIIAANMSDAGEFMMTLAKEGMVSGLLGTMYYEEFMLRQAPWGSPHYQPAHRCVDHLCALIIRIVQHGAGQPDRVELTVSMRDLERFAKGYSRE